MMFKVQINYKSRPAVILDLAEEAARQAVERASKAIGGAEGITGVLAWEV